MNLDLPKLEEKIIKSWKQGNIFAKSIKQRNKARNFVFYEGPPTANGEPGIHHVESRVFKDVICRYKTMQGFRVVRKAGWDTHGLPVELEVEKSLGLKSKKDIEKYGIAKFNKLCKESVWKYKGDWEKLTERVAFWLNMEDPYITYTPEYIETIWWMIKEFQKKNLLYKGHRVLPYCPRCGTGLSSHEVAQGYKKVKENSVYIKFKIISKNKKWKDSFILSWTTTPWTLPGNVALAINSKIAYVKAKTSKGIVVLAKERLSALEEDYKVLEEMKGKDLIGLEYEPLFKFPPLKSKQSYKIYPADFVTTEEGTGVVHTAVMYGEDDYNLGKEVGLPTCHTVTGEGKFVKGLADGLADLYVKDKKSEDIIIESLKKKSLLFGEEMYEHDYPFCWRCDAPLLYFAKESWFINMQKVKKDLIRENQKIKWVPAHLQKGRFGEWLDKIKDWAISRERYWGTPLPIWQCQKCDQVEVIGGREDLQKQKFTSNKYFALRHAESVRNVKKLTSSWPEKFPSPLTKKGEARANVLAKALKKQKIDLILSSDLQRTKQTAEIIGKELKLKPEYDKRLREFDAGIFNGKNVEEVAKSLRKEGESPEEHFLRRFDTRVSGGENWKDLQGRLADFLKTVDKKYNNKNILIVSHELPITLLEGMVRGFSRKEIIKYREKKKIDTGEYRSLPFVPYPFNEDMEIDLHRPFIDEVKFQCPKCQGLMERTKEVMDCWFDSGAVPFAQYHYPFENKSLIDKNEQFPADYISEAIDQTRGWFYTLHAISNLLGKGLAYKNVISLGHVLDEKGEKMSKSKGNIVKPDSVIEKYGADTIRWYFFTINQPGDSKLFRMADLDQVLKRFILTLWNSYTFFETYQEKSLIKKPSSKNVLDKWIISRLNSLISEVSQRVDDYDVTGSARAIESFVVDNLSQWYIRRSRKRFQRPENKKELKEASETLGFVLLSLSKITAPFIPFLSEEIFQKLDKKESCHLEDWPKVEKRAIDLKIEKKMEKVREVVAQALAERSKAGIKVRQPLASLQISSPELRGEKELLELVKDEVNVKQIIFGKKLKLDTKITPVLQEEGMVREVIRNIQEMRKRAELKPTDKISVRYSGDAGLVKILTRQKDSILKEARVKDLALGDRPEQVFDVERELEVEQQKLWLAIKKL